MFEFTFSVRQGTIDDYATNADSGIEIVSSIDDQYSYILYRHVVFLMDCNKDTICNSSIRKCTDDYAYLCFLIYPAQDILFNEYLEILETMARKLGYKYLFIVTDSNYSFNDKRVIDSGYEEFDGINNDLMAEMLGARIVYDKSFRKLIGAE